MEQNMHLPQETVRLKGYTDTARAQAPAILPHHPAVGKRQAQLLE